MEELYDYILQGRLDDVRRVVETIDINQLWDGWTPLHVAVTDGRSEIVECLIDNGADCNVMDEFGNTPLRCAISHFEVKKDKQDEYCHIARLLLNRVSDETDTTPYRDIVMGINMLGRKNELSEEDYRVLCKLSTYRNWHIRFAVLWALEERKDIPKYIMERVINMQDDPDWHVNSRAKSIIEEFNRKNNMKTYNKPLRSWGKLARHCGLLYYFNYLMDVIVPQRDDMVSLLVEDEGD